MSSTLLKFAASATLRTPSGDYECTINWQRHPHNEGYLAWRTLPGVNNYARTEVWDAVDTDHLLIHMGSLLKQYP